MTVKEREGKWRKKQGRVGKVERKGGAKGGIGKRLIEGKKERREEKVWQ